MRLQQRLLQRLHPLGFLVDLVIVAEQVQHAVHHEKCKFVIEGSSMMALAFVLGRIRSAIVAHTTMSPIKSSGSLASGPSSGTTARRSACPCRGVRS